MALHRVARDDLDKSLLAIIRSGEKLDTYYADGDEWVIVTIDRFEIRPAS
jgi:hypothetical protein